jgi:hypothetical protein
MFGMHKTKGAILAALALLLVGVAACDTGGPTPAPTQTPAAGATSTPEATEIVEPTQVVAPTRTRDLYAATSTPASGGPKPSARHKVQFAAFKVQPSSVNPVLKPYAVEPGMANVANKDAYPLSPAMVSLIEQNAFAAQFSTDPDYPHKQFYQLYEDGRYENKPVFVTTDSVLHVYHLMFDKVLRTTETKYLIPYLQDLTASLLVETQKQYDTLKGGPAENAARRNLAYFSVAAKLLDPAFTPAADVASIVDEEMQLIDAHAGLNQSAVMGIDGEEFIEDYGQYNPRGHYTRSENLKKYFRAMMWYGRITFRLNKVDETRSALLLTQALQSAKSEAGQDASTIWANIYDPTAFFVGGADDLTFRDYEPLMEEALGAGAGPQDIADDAKVQRFLELAEDLRGPLINSMFVYIWEDKEDATKGLRMMGQRFTLDEYVFGQLIWREVGSQGNERWLPRALDFPAALGSKQALEVLDTLGETRYPNYRQQLDKVRAQIRSLPNTQWTENLYWSWLHTFRPLIVPKAPDSGYPSFMTNDAWTRKSLNTVLGSWTELKHDTLLYAKQVMAEMGGGPPQDVKGYVEPEPEFYARIAALAGMTRDGLVQRGLLEVSSDPSEKSDYNAIDQLEKLALDLKRISEKELKDEALTAAEYELIKYYGGRIEEITIQSSDVTDEGSGVPQTDIHDQDAAVVADVATGNGLALEEGTGRIMEIYVVVPIEGQLVLTRGGIYSHYEFTQSSGERLTDEQWRERLNNNQVPPLDEWKDYIAK